ncbi:MAG: hypothetical protein ACR2NZ_00890 [Rubripirellula sp.]
MRTVFTHLILVACFPLATFADVEASTEEKPRTKTLNVLFVGNSYTARHNLAEVVKQLAEAGDPDLVFKFQTVIYGGRTLADHWRLGTGNIVDRQSLTRERQERTVKTLQKAVKANAEDRYAPAALKRHQQLLKELESGRIKWDVVVLQSYRDDLEGEESLYAQYAPRFAALAQEAGARVVLYETTPTTQNAQPIEGTPDEQSVLSKAKAIAALANQVDATVAPMSWVGLRCQQARPDLTLRFVNDAHLNQTMAYLTACSLYAAIFGKSPEGLPVESVTDIRYFNNKDRSKDRDGKPITLQLSKSDREQLQQIAWRGVEEFEALRRELSDNGEG